MQPYTVGADNHSNIARLYKTAANIDIQLVEECLLPQGLEEEFELITPLLGDFQDIQMIVSHNIWLRWFRLTSLIADSDIDGSNYIYWICTKKTYVC